MLRIKNRSELLHKNYNNMKKLSYVFYLVLVAFANSCTNDEDNIKVGQIWKETLYEDDPYRKAVIDYKEVIEITGKYVLYVKNKKDTLHEKKYWFVVNSECVSNCN
jgi:hypothetical protein